VLECIFYIFIYYCSFNTTGVSHLKIVRFSNANEKLYSLLEYECVC